MTTRRSYSSRPVTFPFAYVSTLDVRKPIQSHISFTSKIYAKSVSQVNDNVIIMISVHTIRQYRAHHETNCKTERYEKYNPFILRICVCRRQYARAWGWEFISKYLWITNGGTSYCLVKTLTLSWWIFEWIHFFHLWHLVFDQSCFNIISYSVSFLSSLFSLLPSLPRH